MLDDERPCREIAQQLQAVESAINAAKKTLIHDHLGECLEHAICEGTHNAQEVVEEFRSIAKYL